MLIKSQIEDNLRYELMIILSTAKNINSKILNLEKELIQCQNEIKEKKKL